MFLCSPRLGSRTRVGGCPSLGESWWRTGRGELRSKANLVSRTYRIRALGLGSRIFPRAQGTLNAKHSSPVLSIRSQANLGIPQRQPHKSGQSSPNHCAIFCSTLRSNCWGPDRDRLLVNAACGWIWYGECDSRSANPSDLRCFNRKIRDALQISSVCVRFPFLRKPTTVIYVLRE